MQLISVGKQVDWALSRCASLANLFAWVGDGVATADIAPIHCLS